MESRKGERLSDRKPLLPAHGQSSHRKLGHWQRRTWRFRVLAAEGLNIRLNDFTMSGSLQTDSTCRASGLGFLTLEHSEHSGFQVSGSKFRARSLFWETNCSWICSRLRFGIIALTMPSGVEAMCLKPISAALDHYSSPEPGPKHQSPAEFVPVQGSGFRAESSWSSVCTQKTPVFSILPTL